MSSVSTKRMLGFAGGVVWARLSCVCAIVMPSPASTPNKSVATKRNDCFGKIHTPISQGGGRTELDPPPARKLILTSRGDDMHPHVVRFSGQVACLTRQRAHFSSSKQIVPNVRLDARAWYYGAAKERRGS